LRCHLSKAVADLLGLTHLLVLGQLVVEKERLKQLVVGALVLDLGKLLKQAVAVLLLVPACQLVLNLVLSLLDLLHALFEVS